MEAISVHGTIRTHTADGAHLTVADGGLAIDSARPLLDGKPRR